MGGGVVVRGVTASSTPVWRENNGHILTVTSEMEDFGSHPLSGGLVSLLSTPLWVVVVVVGVTAGRLVLLCQEKTKSRF